MQSFWLIGLGGFVGSTARFLIQTVLYRWVPHIFPIGTLAVNVAGSFLIGILYGLSYRGQLNEQWKSLLIVGICGGFTTFSSFSFETVTLLRQGHYAEAFLYISLSVLLCVGATALGLIACRQ